MQGVLLIPAPTPPGPGLCMGPCEMHQGGHYEQVYGGSQELHTLWACTAAAGVWLLKGTPKFRFAFIVFT